MGSVCIALPARLGHAGDVTLVGGLAQADPAEAELAVISARATAATAAVVFPALVLGFAALADLLGSLGHALLTLLGGALAVFVALGALAVLGLGLQARLLFFFLFLGGFFFLFALGLARTALLRERHTEPQQQFERLQVGFRRRRHRHVEAAHDVDRVVIDFGEDQLLFDAHRVVAAAVEAARVEPAEVTDARDRDRGEAIEELPHAGAAQRRRDADRHALAQFEGGDRFPRFADVRVL